MKITSSNIVSQQKENVGKMFDKIAKRYDLINHILSFGMDRLWRKKMVSLIPKVDNAYIIDIATGTGDLAIELLALNPKKIIGIDISVNMLDKFKSKLKKNNRSGLIEIIHANVEKMPYENNKFDIITIAFGLRNFYSHPSALAEIKRVLKPSGYIAVLEFCKTENKITGIPQRFYINKVVPSIGKRLSKNNSAYQYLSDSISGYCTSTELIRYFREGGFKIINYQALIGGVAHVFIAQK